MHILAGLVSAIVGAAKFRPLRFPAISCSVMCALAMKLPPTVSMPSPKIVNVMIMGIASMLLLRRARSAVVPVVPTVEIVWKRS